MGGGPQAQKLSSFQHNLTRTPAGGGFARRVFFLIEAGMRGQSTKWQSLRRGHTLYETENTGKGGMRCVKAAETTQEKSIPHWHRFDFLWLDDCVLFGQLGLWMFLWLRNLLHRGGALLHTVLVEVSAVKIFCLKAPRFLRGLLKLFFE